MIELNCNRPPTLAPTSHHAAVQQNPATETDTMHSPRLGPNSANTTPTLTLPGLRTVASMAAAAGLAVLLSGCTGNMPANFGSSTPLSATVHIMGSVYGGQTPIVGATVQLYAVGTSGVGSASSALISQTPTPGQNSTSATGGFNISGLYTCPAPSSEVYLTATGGNPGGSNINSDLALVVALGDCNTLVANASIPGFHVAVNEATTVAAAYGLAPFASTLTNIGATGVEPAGLVNAFANANLLASYSSGNAGGDGLAPGVTVPTTEINTIADILASCVNSGGGASGDGSACGTLFSATGVTTNTFDAALQIAKHPGAGKITALFNTVPPQAPFQPTLSGTPADFSVAVTYAGSSSLASPWGIAIDTAGNAWVTNESSSNITEFTPSGTAANFTATGLVGPQGIAIDNSGNVWVANTAGNSVIEFPSGNVNSPSSFTAGGITGPTAIAVDHNNNIFIANLNGNSVTELNTSGAPLNSSPLLAGGNITVPTGIAVAPSGGNVLVTSGSPSGSVAILSNTGSYLQSLNDGTLVGPVALAYAGSQLAVTGFTTGASVAGALSEFSGATAAANSPAISGVGSPSGVASDGVSFFVANNSASGGLTQFTYGAAASTSPATGYGALNTPVGVAVDASGSVWTANSGSNTVAKFIGLSQPANTPLVANVAP
jgi:DNA-binding beta-propeller fold protein YncE